MRDITQPISNLSIGRIIEIDGTHIIAELDNNIADLIRIYEGNTYPIGQFGSIIKIHFGRKIVYAYVSRLLMKSEYIAEKGLTILNHNDNERIIEADLFGEGQWFENDKNEWQLIFERGVVTFPLPMQKIYLTPASELKYIYGHGKGTNIIIGEHVGSAGLKCFADLNELVGKHTAILGSTGSGKSGAVSVILHSILDKGIEAQYQNWKPNIIILDPHNEYSSAFKKSNKLSSDDNSLILPYWLLSLQETISLFIGKTEFVATSQSNILKSALLNARKEAAKELNLRIDEITMDSPIPYKISILESNIVSQRPTQESKQEPYNSILNKIDVLKKDSRFNFLMNEWESNKDDFLSIMRQFISNESAVNIIDLSGIPNEVAGIVSAVIARTLFNFKVWETLEERKNNPILLVCEEAHRYVPNRGEATYEAAQEAIKRVAKEGRKYGLGLLLVSQRPSEIEPTVLSQCNSWLVLRLTNDSDREQVRSFLPDSLSGLTKVLSGLRRREAIFVGQAAMLPSRILLNKLEENQLPRSHDIDFNAGWKNSGITDELILEITNRWRYQSKNS